MRFFTGWIIPRGRGWWMLPGASLPAAGDARGGNGHEKSRRDGGSAGMSAVSGWGRWLPCRGGGMSRDCRNAALSPSGGSPVVNGVLPRHCREAALPGELLRRVDVGGVRGHAVAAPAGEDVHVQVGH